MTFDPYSWHAGACVAVSSYVYVVYVTRDKNLENYQEKAVTIVSNTGEACIDRNRWDLKQETIRYTLKVILNSV